MENKQPIKYIDLYNSVLKATPHTVVALCLLDDDEMNNPKLPELIQRGDFSAIMALSSFQPTNIANALTAAETLTEKDSLLPLQLNIISLTTQKKPDNIDKVLNLLSEENRKKFQAMIPCEVITHAVNARLAQARTTKEGNGR